MLLIHCQRFDVLSHSGLELLCREFSLDIITRSALEKAALSGVSARAADSNEFSALNAACLNYSWTIFNKAR